MRKNSLLLLLLFIKKSSFNQIPFFCANHNKKISRQYKDYINEKFNEIEKEKQNKKTFQNDSEFEEEKEDFENDENEMKYEDEDEKDEKFSELCKSIASMSIADDDSENNQNEDKKEEEEESTKQKHSGTNDSMDLDDYDKNNNFNLNFEKIAKNVEKIVIKLNNDNIDLLSKLLSKFIIEYKNKYTNYINSLILLLNHPNLQKINNNDIKKSLCDYLIFSKTRAILCDEIS